MSNGRLVGRPVIMAELIANDLHAIYGLSAGAGGDILSEMKLWPNFQPRGLISHAMTVP
jgi:hypothetical protein